MDLHILGALEVTRDGRPVALGGGRQQALLALLTIERNRPVSGDRIVEELWNGRAPATAPKVVQNLVSQLRRALGPEDVLRTRGHGYELAVPDEALDAARFERLLEQGRQALADGRPEEAGRLLREALGLWRGPAFGDLAGEPWAAAEAARLEERRLVALERRIDADLALGRHADVAGELEALVAREPLREGLRGRLMLALYRGGRQAEALEAYQAARRTLAEELGLEPSPALARLHADILHQEAILDAPAVAKPRRAALPARRAPAPALLIGGGLVLAAAAAAAALLVGGGGERPRAAGGAGLGQLVALDAATGAVQRRLPAGRAPTTVAARAGQLWSIDGEGRTLVHADTRTGTVETLATGATPVDVAIGSGAIWIENGAPRERTLALGPVASELVELDPATRRQRGQVRLPPGGTDVSGGFVDRVAVSPEAVWAITGDGSIVRVDPATRSITGVTRSLRAYAIAAGGAGVWALTEAKGAVELDARSGRIRRRARLPTDTFGTLTVGDDAAWVTSSLGDRLWRVGTGSGGVAGSLDVEAGVTDVAASAGDVWLANPIAGTVTHVDAATMRVVRTVRVGGLPRALAIDGRTIWVGVSGTAPATSAEVAGVAPLPSSICGPVMAAGQGAADVLVASDLPLQGDARLTAGQMAQAITFVLREHRFRAGRLRLAYQSCDDALPGSGHSDAAKCAANGRAYAADADVVAVIGTFNSGCAESLLPELNRAAGGPLGLISPLNSYVGLTRMAPGIDIPGELGRLYPTGRRNFVRIFPADDLQGAALARFARDRGARRVFALDDGYRGYSNLIADAFARAASRLGVEVAGRGQWKTTARSYAALVRRVAAARPRAVLVSGLLNSNAGALVRALRARLGPGVDLLGSDGMGTTDLLKVAGPAARGIFVAYTGGLVPERLPAAGQRFVARFAPTQPGGRAESFAVYAAQATETLIDALARSDGTRASVIDQLFRTQQRGTLIGDVAFDRRGDITAGAVTILRVAGRGQSTNVASVDGVVVERVMRLSPKEAEAGPDG
jgi:DNA-binding SARP family transcriptional activator/ABC-type branched-subunit amino acid transport system substrate-binding protein